MTESASSISKPSAESIAVVTITLAMLASWLPQYLTWPWWPDADAWATIAQGWDSGIRPYRDVVIFNFPGQIEISWILGKLFGWGRTWPFYAFDAALLIGFGPLLAVWSKKRLGQTLPGLIGWLGVVWIYCGLSNTLVAQRDWQGPLLALSSLAILQSFRGRTGAIISAALMASAFTIRPHVVLFLPAIGLALLCDCGPWRPAIRKLILWSVSFLVFGLIWFAPLIVQGLIPDFIKGVRQASYGAGYSSTSPSSVLTGVGRQLGVIAPEGKLEPLDRFLFYVNGLKVLATLLALAVIATISFRERRFVILPWLAVLAIVPLYQPLAPKQHTYLVLPLKLCWAVGFGIVAGLILEALSRRKRGDRIAAFLLLMTITMPGVPMFCLPSAAWDAIWGRYQAREPETARLFFSPGNPNTPYRWDDYWRTLDYLRRNTDESTRVANVLRNIPFPAINGPVGRISPLPGESGVIWLWSVNPKLEPNYARAIEQVPKGSVVVWSPNESVFTDALKLETLCAAIRKTYHREARFGAFEIWRN